VIPRKIELERAYLQEALQIISNPQSESYGQILNSFFSQATPQHVEIMFDTDVATKLHKKEHQHASKKPGDGLISALDSLGSAHGTNVELVKSLAMSSVAMAAATSTLRRARGIGKTVKKGKEGESLRGVPRSAAIAVAMNAATAAAVTGASESDPSVVQFVCDNLRRYAHSHFVSDQQCKARQCRTFLICSSRMFVICLSSRVFDAHGAVQLSSPLLRPRTPGIRFHEEQFRVPDQPAELINKRGTVVMLPEDLTANFARAVARSGNAATRVKRYCFDKVYHSPLAGGHPRENFEASFDIVFEDPYVAAEYLEAEVMMVISGAMRCLVQRPFWFLRLTHSRLADR